MNLGRLFSSLRRVQGFTGQRAASAGGDDSGSDIPKGIATARQAAEGLLREGGSEFRAMLDAIPVGVYTTDAEGRLTYYNPAIAEVAGRTPQLGIDQWCLTWKLRRPDGSHLPHDECPMAVALREGRPVRGVEVVVERPDGTLVPCMSYPTPLRDARGKLIGGVNMVFDLTEHKRAEEALKEADRYKDEFLAMLSHELRNPLAPMRNAVQLLHDADDERQIREQARGILDRQVARLTRLVEDLHDIARIAKGRISLKKRLVSVGEIIEMAVETSRPLADALGHVIEIDAPEIQTVLFADPVRLDQAIANLISNAAKYTPYGGKIQLALRTHARSVAISVRDNGVGIAPEELPQAFEMFTRLKNEQPDLLGGLGIGLALARKLVELHGGSIDARSDGIDRGAEFTVSIPLPDSHAPMSGSASNAT